MGQLETVLAGGGGTATKKEVLAVKRLQRILLTGLLIALFLEPLGCERGPTQPDKRQDETTEEESRIANPGKVPVVQPEPDRR